MATRKKPNTKGPAKTTNQQGKKQIGKEFRSNATKKVERGSTAVQGNPPPGKTTLQPVRIRVTRGT